MSCLHSTPSFQCYNLMLANVIDKMRQKDTKGGEREQQITKGEKGRQKLSNSIINNHVWLFRKTWVDFSNLFYWVFHKTFCELTISKLCASLNPFILMPLCATGYLLKITANLASSSVLVDAQL